MSTYRRIRRACKRDPIDRHVNKTLREFGAWIFPTRAEGTKALNTPSKLQYAKWKPKDVRGSFKVLREFIQAHQQTRSPL